MTYRELLQEALESIKWLRLHLERDHACLHMKPTVSGIPDWLNKTEASLRARLSQPEPEPVAWGLQQQFEGKIGTAPVAFKRHDEFGFVVPLYTAPPPREWVGLTDEELHALHFELKVQTMGGMNTLGMYRIIEAKLNEKNGY